MVFILAIIVNMGNNSSNSYMDFSLVSGVSERCQNNFKVV